MKISIQIIIIICLFITSCQHDFSPLKQTDISLTADFTGVTDVWLLIETSDTEKEKTFLLERDGKEITRGLIKDEKLYIEENLLPNTRYSYQAFILNEKIKESTSNNVTVTTLDTTSHEFIWQVDTLGDFGSSLKDVAIISENNVWVVGSIQIRQPSYNLYGAAIWDGFKWNLKKLQIDTPYANVTPEGIWAFSENDIWFASGSIYHRNGDTTELSYLRDILGGELITKVWGTSSNNMYAIGYDGVILHYDGNTWTHQNSGVTVDLNTITGLMDKKSGKTRVWIGGDLTLLYSDDGENWQVVWDAENPILPDDYLNPTSLRMFADKYVLASVLKPFNTRGYLLGKDNNYFFKHIYSSEIVTLTMCGENINNILLAGTFNNIAHFNGKNSVSFSRFSMGDGWFVSSDSKNNTHFIVGWTNITNQAVVVRAVQ